MISKPNKVMPPDSSRKPLSPIQDHIQRGVLGRFQVAAIEVESMSVTLAHTLSYHTVVHHHSTVEVALEFICVPETVNWHW